jgi:hypothetical protein
MWSRQLQPPNELTREQMEAIVLGSQRVQTAIDRVTSDTMSGQSSASSSSSSSGGSAWTREEANKTAKAMFDGQRKAHNRMTQDRQ